MTTDTTDTILFSLGMLGVFQGVFLAVFLLLHRSANKTANTLLSILLLMIALRAGKSVFNHFYEISATQRNLGLAAMFTFGPLFWWYGQALAARKPRYPIIHFLPAVGMGLFSSIIPNETGEAWSRGVYAVLLAHFGFYLLVSWRAQVSNGKEKETKTAMAWYKQVLAGGTILWLCYLGIFLRFIPFYLTGAILFSFLTYFIAYVAMNGSGYWGWKEKYRHSSLSEAEKKEYNRRLHRLMNESKPYLDPDTTLGSVASKLQISERQLSQVVNQENEMNFSEFVNSLRVEEAKRIMESAGGNVKLTAVGYEVGFKSPSAFYAAFKQCAGMPPGEYCKKLIPES